MTVRKKATHSVNSFIDRGADVKESKEKEFQNVLFRIPKNILKQLDECIQKKPWINRTQWIVEAIHEKLNKESE
jgi:hypothetical protein